MRQRRTLLCIGTAAAIAMAAIGLMIMRVCLAGTDEPSAVGQLFAACSPHSLPPAERRLVEFLLLLPVAALIICVFRNVIGLTTFGTFAPALLGLAFREVDSPAGIMVFALILFAGWMLRRVLSHYQLLQVPRAAFMLSVVVCLLIAFVMIANSFHLQATRYITLFPLVILTGMIERFWTLEEEDGTAASFRTLLSTFVVACCVCLVVRLPAVTEQMNRFPETLGLVMAAQLLLGRYTGYRLLELYRFRDLLKSPEFAGNQVQARHRASVSSRNKARRKQLDEDDHALAFQRQTSL